MCVYMYVEQSMLTYTHTPTRIRMYRATAEVGNGMSIQISRKRQLRSCWGHGCRPLKYTHNPNCMKTEMQSTSPCTTTPSPHRILPLSILLQSFLLSTLHQVSSQHHKSSVIQSHSCQETDFCYTFK